MLDTILQEYLLTSKRPSIQQITISYLKNLITVVLEVLYIIKRIYRVFVNQQQDCMGKILHTILKDWLSICNQNKSNTVAPHITHLICSSVLPLTISLRLVESCSQLASSFHLCLHFHFCFTHYICSLTETMSRKFWQISRIRREQIWRF